MADDTINLGVADYLANSEQPVGPRLKDSLAQGVEQNPDTTAKVRNYARQLGVPLPAALGDPKYVEAQSKLQALDPNGMVLSHPATANYLTNPDNAAIAHDDVGTLKGIEDSVKALGQTYLGASFMSGVNTLGATVAQLGDKAGSLLGGTDSGRSDALAVYGTSPEAAAQLKASAEADTGMLGFMTRHFGYAGPDGTAYDPKKAQAVLAGQGVQGANSWLPNAASWMTANARHFIENMDPEAQQHLTKIYATVDPSKAAYLDPTRVAGDTLQQLPTLAALILAARTAKGAGAEAEAEALASGASAKEVLQARVQASAKALAAQGAISEGAVGYGQQATQTADELTQGDKAKELEASPVFQHLVGLGFEPDVARIIVADKAADEAGTTAGLADAAVNYFGGGWLGKVIGEGGPLVPRIAKGFLTEGITEGVQSPLEQIGQNTAEQRAGLKVNTYDGALEQAVQGFMLGGLMGGPLAGIAGNHEAQMKKAEDAAHTADTLTNIMKAAEASKLRERDPQSFEEFMAHATEGGPVENLYVPADKLAEVLAQGSNAEIAKAMPSVLDQLPAALASGGLVEVPVAQFAAHAAGTPLAQGLIEHMKVDPQGFTMNEAQEFLQSAGDDLKRDVQAMIEEKGLTDEFQASADRVQTNLQGQLDTANRFTPDVNAAYASLVSKFYATQAARVGTTPEELFAAHPLNIQAQGVTEGALTDELKQPVYHGTPHQFDAFSLDHIGTGEGAQAFGHGLYFAGNKSVAEFYRSTLSGADLPKFDGVDVLKYGERDTEEIRKAAAEIEIEPPTVPGISPEDVARGTRSFGWSSFIHAVTNTRLHGGTAENRLEAVAKEADRLGDYELEKRKLQGQTPTQYELAEVLGHRLQAAYARAILKSGRLTHEKPGRVYHVQIPDDDAFLSWDKHFTEQSPAVRAALEQLGVKPEMPSDQMIADPELRSVVRDALKLTAGEEDPHGDPEQVEMVIDNDQDLYNRVVKFADDHGVDLEEYDGPGAYVATYAREYLEALRKAVAFTGERIYRGLESQANAELNSPLAGATRKLGEVDNRTGAEIASNQLRAAGVPGIRYLDGLSRNQDEGTHNYVLFDPELARITHFEQGEGAATARGTFSPATNTIVLLRNADLSTFLHETGHFYLETLARLASDPAAPEDLKADWVQASAFIGAGPDAAAWLALPVDQRREGHETWARGFEAYLREGRAPALGLKGVFQRFKGWLLHIYQSLSQLNVELTPEVRGVFNRLLATEKEIGEAEAARSYAPVFDLRPDGMSELEWAAYQRLGAEATADAEDTLAARSIRDMRWLQGQRARVIRQLANEAREKRQAVRAEVEAETLQEPVYGAMQFLRRGTIHGEAQEGPHKLAIGKVEELYKDTPKELQDWRRLGYGKYGMLAEEGLDPEHVAELFGFSSGDELVEALMNAEPLREKVDGVADQRMLERYGDLTDRDAIERAADEAIHNDARLRFVATEANALAKAAGKTRVLADAARDFARELIGRQRIRDVKPAKYSGAEARAAQAAQRAAAKGDLAEAATQKRNQLLNGYAAKAAYQAQKEVESALRYLARFDSAATRKGLSPDYREQIDQLLERFDLRKGQSLKTIDKRKSLAAWVEAQKANDLEPSVPDDLLNEAYRKHYRDLSVDELRGLIDTVKTIAHLGRLKNRLLAAKNARDFATTIEQTTHEVTANAIGKPRNNLESNQITDQIERGVRGWFVIHRKFDSLIKRLAGLKDGSVLWNVLVRPKNTAADTEASMLDANARALGEVFRPIMPDKLRKKLFIPEINGSLSLEGRLAVALNWGNEINRKRILDGDGWSEPQVKAILRTLDPRHLAFVQNLWDHLNSFRPEIEAKERRVYGVAPEMVEASPFTVMASDGSLVELRGGYYPISYDPDKSAKAAEFDAIKMAKQAVMGAARGYSKPGHLKARVDEVTGRPLRKSLGVAFQHLNDVIHDLAWHEYIIDAKRLLGNDVLANAIRVHAGPEILSSLKRSVAAMEVGDVPAQNGFERSVNYLRSGATTAGLAWNFMTALQQPLGLLNGTARIGPRWMGAGIKRLVGDAATMQNTVAWVHAKSDFMRLRADATTLSREIHDVRSGVKRSLTSDLLKTVMPGETAVKAMRSLDAVEASFYGFIGKMQMVADMPTWLGQYEKSMSVQDDEAYAISQADQAVRDAQGAGQISDLAEIQRGGPLMKLWTNFYSYFNVVYNQLTESVEETQLKGVSNVPAMAADVLLILVLPSVLGNGLKKLATGGDDYDKWPADLATGLLSDLFGLMVGMRDIGAAVMTGKDAPAGMRILENTAKLSGKVKAGHYDEAFWKDANTEAGILLHYPAAQVQRTVLGLQALADGTSRNPLVAAVGPPAKHH